MLVNVLSICGGKGKEKVKVKKIAFGSWICVGISEGKDKRKGKVTTIVSVSFHAKRSHPNNDRVNRKHPKDELTSEKHPTPEKIRYKETNPM